MAVIYGEKKKSRFPNLWVHIQKWVWPPIKNYIDNKLKAN